MSNNPTIVAASLDDKQMHQSIANLVADVKRATHTMTKDFDSVVDHINAKFKELGNGKNASAKGGVSTNTTKQSTQAVEENTNARKKNAQAVSEASDAVTKETQKLQALQQSLSEASNREQEFVSKKQQAATAIAQENALLSKQQSELSALKAQQQQYNDAVRNQTNAVSSAEQKLKDAQQRRIDLEKQQGALKNDAKLASLKEEYKAISDLIAVAEKYKSVFAKMKDEDMSKMQGKFGWKSWGGLSDAERHLKDAYYDNRQAKWAKEGILSLDDEKVKAAIERVNMGILQAAKENYSRAIFDKIKNENWGAKDISSWIATMQSKMQRVVQTNRETGIDSRIDEEYQAYKHIISVLKEYLQYAEKVGQERKKLAESSVAVSTAMKNATTHDNVVGSMTNLDSRQFSLITSQMAREKEIKDQLLANDNQLTEAKNKEAEATQALSVEKKKLNDLEQQQVQATQQSAQASQQKATTDSQIAAKEAEIAATKGRISTATQSQSEAEKAVAAASKEKATIQTQVANQEKALVEAKKQLTTATQRQTEVEKQSSQAVSQQVTTADKQIKKNQEVSMSFDQIVAALDRARRTVSDFNTKRANGVLPSTEDYKRYEQALARIVEYNDKLKQSALGMANANEKWFGGFNAKRINESILPSNKTLSDMRAFYQEQEKNDQKRLANIEKERAAREKMIEDAKKAEQKYQDNQLKLAYSRTLKMPTDNIEQMQSKLERLKTLLQSLSEVNLLSPSQIASAEKMIATLSDKIRQQTRAAVVQTQQTAIRMPSEMRMGDTKSARDSFLAFMQGYKQQAQQLQQMIREAEAALDAAVSKRADELTNKINATKQKLNDLNVILAKMKMEAEQTGNYSTFNAGISRAEQAIEYQVKRLAELRKQQDELSPNMFAGQVAEIDKLRAKRESILGIMKEEVTVAEKKVAVESRVSAEITKQIQSVSSAKTAREAISQVFTLPEGNIEQGKAKIESLMMLREKLSSVPLVSKKVLADIDQAVTSLKLKYSEVFTAAAESEKGASNETQAHIALVKQLTSEAKRFFEVYGHQSFSLGGRANSVIYAENDARAKGLTIEQQIEKSLKEEREATATLVQTQNSALSAEQKKTSELDHQVKKIEELLAKGKEIKLLGGFRIMSEDQSGMSVLKQIESYQIQRKEHIIAENQQLNLQLELDNAIAQAEGRITEERKKRKTYETPNMSTEYYGGIRNKAISHTLGIDEKDVVEAGGLNSVKRMNDALKQLQDTYIRLSAEDRNSPFGRRMAVEMQTLERETQKVRKAMSRPIDLKSALSGSEKTLDDIAYKMQRLRAYKQGIDPVRRGADTEIRQINNELARLQKTADNWMGKQQEMIKGNTALGRSWNYMKNRLAFYLTVGATTQFVRQLVDIRSQYEMNERALGILIDSAERGTRIFNELSQMSLVSPYTLIELTTAAKQLSAYDIAAKDVVDTTRRLADMASAVGIPIERLTYALGQIKAYGYLNSRDARMFSNAGIPLVKQLSEYYTQLEGRLVSTADVYDRIKKKTVDFEEVVNVIHHMTDEGGKFFDFQAKMADTLKVRLANLQLAWNNMLNDIGEESEGVIRGGIGVLRDLFANWKDIKHYVDEAVVAFGAYKVAQLLIAQTTGVAARSMTSEILAMKRTEVELLRKKALTQELTASEKAMIATSKVATVTDYQNALSTKNLTKQKALLLAAFNMNNKKMLEALIRMGLLTSAEIRSMTVGKAMTLVFKSMGLAISSAARAIGAFLASNWVFILLGAAFELYHAFDSASEHIKDINRGLIEDAKNTYKDLKDFLESVEPIRIKIKAGKLEDSEAQKAWDDLRERLETLSANSAIYISKLMGQDDMTQRLKEGYEYAEMLQKVQGIIEGFGDEDIKGTETIWGGFFGEGLKDDIKDFLDVADELVKTYGSIEKAQGELDERLYAGKGIGGALADLYEMNKEIKETINSIVNKSIEENLNIDEQRELFEKAIQKIANESKLSATETRVFRINSEKLYFRELAKMQRKGYNIDLEGARQEFASRKALQQEFFTWLSEVHSSETQKRISNASEEEIKNGEWLTKENKRWIQERAKEFSDKYKVSFGELNSLVQQANTWSIYIPVYFQTAKDSLSEFQKDFYKRAKETFQQDQATAKQVFAGILPEKDDAFPKWVKARQDEIKQLGEDRKKYERDETEWSKQHVKDIDEQIKHNKEALDLYHQPYEEDKKKKKKGKDEILEALKLEISLVDKLNADYDKLTKAGVSQSDALATIRSAYGKTIKELNAQLGRFGLPKLDITKILLGKDPSKQLEHFRNTLNSLTKRGLLNMERAKEVEAIIEKLTVTVQEYNFNEVSKGIEKGLKNLKEKFDLGVALDAEPQLGELFANMFGFESKDLPRTFTDMVKAAQSIIDNEFSKKGGYAKFGLESIDVANILNKKKFDDLVASSGKGLDSTLVKSIQSVRDYLVETRRKMISDTNKEYDKLLERYSEYQFKLIKIDKDSAADRLALIRKFATAQQTELVKNAATIANQITLSTDPEERERLSKELQDIVNKVADGNAAVIQIGIGIDNKEAEEKAQVAFDEFTKNPIWRTAIGDLEGMTHDALRTLIDDLEDFRKANTKLTPKQINQIEKTITKLHRQIRKGNPFRVLADDIDNVEERTKEYEMYIGNLESELQTRALIPDNLKSEDDKKRIIELRKEIEKLKKEVDKVGKIDVTTVFSRINDSVSVINQISSSISKMLDELGGERATAASKAISDITGNLEAAGRGAQIGASFGGYGAAIGAVAGGLTDLVTRFADAWSGNADITKKVEESIRAVKRLEMAYAGLEYQIKKTYGEAEIYANRLLIENKKAQLAELQNQLTLARSRKSKNRNADEELELQARIESLTREIEESVKEITDSLLGISSVKDAATQLVESMIDAFKQGEDYMQNFEDSFEKMIENMIVKAVVGKVIGDKIQQLVDFVDSQTNAVDQGLLDEYKKNEEKIRHWTEMLDNPENEFDANTVKDVERKLKELKERNEALQSQMAEKPVITPELIEESRKMKEGLMDETREMFHFYMDLFGIKFGQDMNLSNLQQGISAITEDTANALEAYMNGVSQQVYAHTELLTEIRDAVIAFNGDATLGVQSQMLLQLQNNYILMQTMQTLMENWTVPSGNGIRVELMN